MTLALAYHSDAVPEGVHVDGKVPFASGPMIDRIEVGDPRGVELDDALSMYYGRDTLGQFVGLEGELSGANNRAEHPAVGDLRGTLWTLGWREAGIGAIDKKIRSADHDPGGRVERYAYKYAWIGLYNYPKMQDHYLRHGDRGRAPDVQIDPSFPVPAPPSEIVIPAWARPVPADDRRWLRQGIVSVPNELLYLPSIGPHPGPWIAAYAYLSSRITNPRSGRIRFSQRDARRCCGR